MSRVLRLRKQLEAMGGGLQNSPSRRMSVTSYIYFRRCYRFYSSKFVILLTNNLHYLLEFFHQDDHFKPQLAGEANSTGLAPGAAKQFSLNLESKCSDPVQYSPHFITRMISVLKATEGLRNMGH